MNQTQIRNALVTTYGLDSRMAYTIEVWAMTNGRWDIPESFDRVTYDAMEDKWGIEPNPRRVQAGG